MLPDRLVISQVYGGLGNQLFQYAAGLALARRSGAELWLDVSQFDGYPLRRYLLDHYALEGRTATPAELRAAGERPGLWPRLRRRLGWPLRRTVPEYLEGEHRYRPLALPPGGRVHLKGYWQSERYFDDMAAHIRRAFTPKAPAKGANAAALRAIRAAGTRAVSLHVRRGDYVSNPQAQAFHGLTGLDYYRAADKRLRKHVAKPAYFAFSDDPAWTKANLKLGAALRVFEHNSAEEPWEDLRLMAACAHFIIANSSFSWWGAWLGWRQDKRVIAPKRWFAQPGMGAPDLLPRSWERL